MYSIEERKTFMHTQLFAVSLRHARLSHYTDLSYSNVVKNASKTVMGIMRGEVK
jgi:hypothetical protein